MSHSEIAQIVNLPLGTVNSRARLDSVNTVGALVSAVLLGLRLLYKRSF